MKCCSGEIPCEKGVTIPFLLENIYFLFVHLKRDEENIQKYSLSGMTPPHLVYRKKPRWLNVFLLKLQWILFRSCVYLIQWPLPLYYGSAGCLQSLQLNALVRMETFGPNINIWKYQSTDYRTIIRGQNVGALYRFETK